MSFDKSAGLFPALNEKTFLAHCSISPMFSPAADRAIELIREQQFKGVTTFGDYYLQELSELKKHAGHLLRTSPDNIASVRNTSEALSIIANGYPFEAGDEVISYVHEYPANYYPWRLQERRGVRLKLLSDVPARGDLPSGLPGSWSMEELELLITDRTRVIALSHVQFTSGYAADLRALGDLCRRHDIDLIIDAAQSLGSMPIYPEAFNIAALASAGWKWLMGPFGTGIFYISEALREKVALTQVGAETMQQGMDFLDHSWNPHSTARRFEYSSSPVTLVAALATCLREVHARYGADAIFEEILRLQDHFLEHLAHPDLKPLRFSRKHRSGILALYCPDLKGCAAALSTQDLICSPRGGYLRVAPHYYNTEEQVEQLAAALNRSGSGNP